jgi:hypothetical protein
VIIRRTHTGTSAYYAQTIIQGGNCPISAPNQCHTDRPTYFENVGCEQSQMPMETTNRHTSIPQKPFWDISDLCIVHSLVWFHSCNYGNSSTTSVAAVTTIAFGSRPWHTATNRTTIPIWSANILDRIINSESGIYSQALSSQ